MKKIFKIFTSLFIAMQSTFCPAQNVGVNTATPQATLDVYGDLILRSADIVVADGTTLAMDVNSNRFSYYRVAGPAANFTVAGITQGVEGRLITLFNRSGFTMRLNNLDVSANVNDRIITGTNADLTIDDKGIVNLQFDGLEQKWIVLSSNKPTGGAVSGGWGLNGNSGNTASNFIGNTDFVPLILKTNNSNVAKFDGTNTSLGFNAGAGLTSGGNNYFLGGQMRSPLTTTNYSVAIGTNAEISGDNQIIIGAPFHKTGIGLGYNETPDHTVNIGRKYSNTGALKITGTGYSSHFNYGNEEHTYIRAGKLLGKVFINDQNGGDIIIGSPTTSSIGIGTSTPDGNARTTIQTAADYATALVMRNPSGSATFNAFIGGPDNGNTISLGTPGAMPVVLYTNSANRLFISANGNIGIGTDNPDAAYLLSVNGKIKTRELRVTIFNWADYVFNKKYKLRPLHEVEQYIKKYKHLPGIKNGAAIQKEGIDISTMQTKMMEKIEELTLYLIEANKKIEALQKAVKNR
ncbi:hypothetical protein [Ferruginibacter sp.]